MPHQLTLLDAGQIKRPNNPFKESNNTTHPEMVNLPLTLKRRRVFADCLQDVMELQNNYVNSWDGWGMKKNLSGIF